MIVIVHVMVHVPVDKYAAGNKIQLQWYSSNIVQGMRNKIISLTLLTVLLLIYPGVIRLLGLTQNATPYLL